MSDRQKCKAYHITERGVLQWCEVKNNCHRWTDQPKEVQAYGPPALDFMPKDGCENYFPLKWKPS